MLILASSSPRRSGLLRQWGYDFRQVIRPVAEKPLSGSALEKAVQDLAKCKALAVIRLGSSLGPGRNVVLGADTVVVLDGRVFGKPLDGEDARKMLSALSGKTHQVITAIALVETEGKKVAEIETDFDVTTVSFRDINLKEIQDYIGTGEPLDKAAAYAIQGGAKRFVERVAGSLTNVIGLPMELLASHLERRGIFPGKAGQE